ncbi:hypothetical protein FEK48_15485 [Escherichia sp. E2593]|uniref:hypothetical protein n=1 Tax=Escherichia TaxID=561 RepID=UPI001028B105|nr:MULTISPECIES: hypothetical protein [Escherichia]EIH0320161.1 hypothetical protein [Escherichia coli O112]EKY6711238.1 hypothetical protein [Escherichia coli]QST56635.1 hypothetical protein JRC41_06990 [Escherichia albertii]RZN40043.1 hypothetical protein D9738_15580 [Escherichia sp. E10V5]TGC07133.1 hypothetical protein CRG93_17645 [Escherichia sp. E2593]
MTSNITSAILAIMFIEIGVIAIYLFRKLTGHEERFVDLNIEYIAAYTKGLFPAAIGAVLIAFIVHFIG